MIVHSPIVVVDVVAATAAIPCIMKDITPTLVASTNAKLKSDSEAIAEMSRNRKSALKYIQDHMTEWETCLKNRHDTYWQYMRCVNTIDLYTECLEEEPNMYIPRKFRKDKTHCRDAAEKREVERMNHERLKSAMQVLQIRKTSYHNELQFQDKEDEEYLRRQITDTEVLDNVLEIWKTSTKKDEESIQEEWVKKNEGMRQNFEKDKRETAEKAAGQIEPRPAPETRAPSAPTAEEIFSDGDETDDERNNNNNNTTTTITNNNNNNNNSNININNKNNNRQAF